MELEKKTTILFPPKLHAQLVKIAKLRGKSLGQLVREACQERYGGPSVEDRLAGVREMSKMSLPVGTIEQMKRESIPDPDQCLHDSD